MQYINQGFVCRLGSAEKKRVMGIREPKESVAAIGAPAQLDRRGGGNFVYEASTAVIDH
ncbi:hypothetical protein [Variovorax sp. J31P207]|uniref:hypothetical protein n=1 Tax=Variovorax sp. J31P207 TaxID=3053510 RepID=UPI0025767663|nr:hypothetical protein [Variovorax sp. J31P207]MDM0067685.1 hypothetical protein [Variovorax sp. J31P207]